MLGPKFPISVGSKRNFDKKFCITRKFPFLAYFGENLNLIDISTKEYRFFPEGIFFGRIF